MRYGRSLAFLALSLVGVPTGWPSEAAAQAASGSCVAGNRVVRSVAGAALGAFVGLVAWKVRYSDWSDITRTGAGIQARNQAMLAGAVVGALVGNLPPLTPACAIAREERATRSEDVRSVIGSVEIQKFGANGTVYDLIRSLRPQWLNLRGVSLGELPSVSLDQRRGGVVIRAAEATLIVYLDNARLGDWEQLRTLPLLGVLAVRYYDAAQASQRWGPGHGHGAIQVLTTLQGS